MTERKSKEYDSVDLTEDEDSSEGNSGVESPFHFVDCSGIINESISEAPQVSPTSPSKCVKPITTPISVSKLPIKEKGKFTSIQMTSEKIVERFTSVQIKPSTNPASDTLNNLKGNTLQDIETVSIDSDSEDTVNHLPIAPNLQQNTHLPKQTSVSRGVSHTIYSMNQPPGKVVIIKKNNKYYKIIIPHNVMPNINQALGPVLINIPEVGPLVISNDPQATKYTSSRTQQLSLNLDAINQKQVSLPERRNSIYSFKKENALCDKKFCWTFCRGRKRDLDGFSSKDRLGFNKCEVGRAKKCERMMWSILKKHQVKLINTTCEYDKFKNSLLSKNVVKLVKINTIIGANNMIKDNLFTHSKFTYSGTPPRKKQRKSNLIEAKPDSDSSDMEGYGDDLLVTKKVVILNRDNQEVEIQQMTNKVSIKNRVPRKRGVGRPRKHLKPNKTFKMKPCYVHIVKDKRVEEASLKYCKTMSLNTENKPHIGPKNRVKLQPKFSKRFVENTLKVSRDNQLLLKQAKFFENINVILTSRIIKSEKQLKEEMNNLKPVLIMTDQTIGVKKDLKTYCCEFSKNNIIYVVDSSKPLPNIVLKNEDFISAVELGYVKLVDTNLFCKFVANGMSIPGTASGKHQAEHNYCSRKK